MAAKLARFGWLPGGLTAALVIAIGALFGAEASWLDRMVYDRAMRAQSIEPNASLLVVAIDEASVERLGDWPWSPAVHARLIEQLQQAGARTIVFTTPIHSAPPATTQDRARLRAALRLLESSNLGSSDQARQLRALLSDADASGAEALASAIKKHGDVVLSVAVSETFGQRAPNNLLPRFHARGNAAAMGAARSFAVDHAPPYVDHASALGHLHRDLDADGVLRQDLAVIRVGDALLPSLTIAAATRARGVDVSALAFSPHEPLVMGAQTIALEPTLHIRPHPGSPTAQSFTQTPYWRALAGELPRDLVRDKIVLIGVTAPSLLQNSHIATPAGERSAPVLVAAHQLSSVLDDRLYKRDRIAHAIEWGAAGLAILFAAFVAPACGFVLGAIIAVSSALLLLGLELGLLLSLQLWAHVGLAALAVLASWIMHAVVTALWGEQKGRAPGGSLKALGQTFHKQGQLDLAFETYQRCELEASVMELLYQLGLDFERRHQLNKAGAVYAHIATRDPGYRDLRTRRARIVEAATPREQPAPAPRNAAPAPPVSSRHAAVEDYEPRVAARSSNRTLGRYEIERELGKGAMGVVYLGRDPKINRVVAIKAIPLAEEFEEDDLEEARARFFREAEMAGRLNHPAIVTVYDAGEDHGLAYIAMEYLRGEHLSTFTDPRRLLPAKNVMLLVARVADALHYAHRQNVVHRDIKPANIMFNPDTDELKITDFGIARLTDTSRTKTGIVLGTPSFMSPEQLEGRAIDGRSDQFALGVSFYQLLSGHLPFRAESMPRLMHKIATEPHAPIRLIKPELPEELDAIIDRVLAKSADHRYATCGEFAIALRECAVKLDAPQTETHEWLLP